MDHPVENLDRVRHVLTLMRMLNPADRRRVIEGLSDFMCIHCGDDTDGEQCHCTNDE